ncbi:hypothetical protein T484DRAFT_1890171, partial [Baffinella frigidus]
MRDGVPSTEAASPMGRMSVSADEQEHPGEQSVASAGPTTSHLLARATGMGMLLQGGPRRASHATVWTLSRTGAAAILLLLVAGHLVAPVAAVYDCTSDADCQYPGCNDQGYTAYC